MNGLAAYGVEELDAGTEARLSGGNVALGVAMTCAFTAGLQWGYTVLGPWLNGDL